VAETWAKHRGQPAKGLEFDQVIAPRADADNYRSEIDRNLLYVVCT
jgi:DNA helicase-2/ATP-dependent DNA helicase PcrA